jgi:hypothetical protein
MHAYPSNHVDFVGKRIGTDLELSLYIYMKGTTNWHTRQWIQAIYISFPLFSRPIAVI